jgi:hypothetical protein
MASLSRKARLDELAAQVLFEQQGVNRFVADGGVGGVGAFLRARVSDDGRLHPG